jgi:2'-5' RNA ligase
MQEHSPAIKVGVGALLKGELFNATRLLEINLAFETNLWRGLDQPPHITIKRPFTINNYDMFTKVLEAFDNIANNTEPFTINFEGIQNFNHKVLFLKVSASEELTSLHEKLVVAMLAVDGASKLPAECTDEMVFHTTLALDLEEDEFERMQKHADTIDVSSLRDGVEIGSIGLFLSADGKHWDLVNEKQLQYVDI